MITLQVRERGAAVADRDVGVEAHTHLAHDLEATVQDALFHLELRYAVAQKAADCVTALVDVHGVSGAA